MAKQTTNSAAPDLESMFDLRGYEDAFKTMTSMNERMASIAIEAGTRANDVVSETAREALSNIRDLTQERDDPAAYAQAFTDFVQKQSELFTRSLQAFATDMQKVSGETSELASKTGEEITSKVSAKAESAAKTVNAAVSKAA